MTNDTSTLTGALREAGETLAANLTTQGVPSTWDEGLTTLIGKVLDITPGPTPSFDGITLTGNKNILSAADSEYATLTAQLTDGGSAAAVSGETVTFTIYKDSDDSVVDTLTADTNSSGVATVSYYGQGTGDIYIQAECTFVSETYVIEDCYYYNSTGITFTSSSTTDRQEPTGLEAFEYTPPSHWQLSFDIYDDSNSKRFYLVSKAQSSSGNNKYGIGADTNSNTHNCAMVLRTTTSASQYQVSPDYPAHIRWEIDNGTTKGYVGNTLVRTDSVNWWGNYAPYIFKWGIWAKGTVTVTNIKVKPL